MIRFVHRTRRAVHAARHACFGSRLPACAYCDVPGAQGQRRHECRNTPEHGHRSPSMRNPANCVKSFPQRPWRAGHHLAVTAVLMPRESTAKTPAFRHSGQRTSRRNGRSVCRGRLRHGRLHQACGHGDRDPWRRSSSPDRAGVWNASGVNAGRIVVFRHRVRARHEAMCRTSGSPLPRTINPRRQRRHDERKEQVIDLAR